MKFTGMENKTTKELFFKKNKKPCGETITGLAPPMLATIIFYSSGDLHSPEQEENPEVNQKRLRAAPKR